MGYHLRPIKVRGEFGTIEKMEEELDELREAMEQNNKILALIELTDLYGALRGYLETHFPDISMEDVKNMSDATRRAFLEGDRK